MTEQSGATVGYLFGYGTLADASDPLVLRTAAEDAESLYGHVVGYRRVWNAAVENLDPATDHKYYRTPESGIRPDVAVVSLNMEPAAGVNVNGVAIPVDREALALFDHREHFLYRVEVGDRFTHPIDLPLWAYTAKPESVALYRSARRQGRAVIRHAYLERITRIFKELGPPDAWADFERSTVPPECPVVDLDVVRAPGDAGW